MRELTINEFDFVNGAGMMTDIMASTVKTGLSAAVMVLFARIGSTLMPYSNFGSTLGAFIGGMVGPYIGGLVANFITKYVDFDKPPAGGDTGAGSDTGTDTGAATK